MTAGPGRAGLGVFLALTALALVAYLAVRGGDTAVPRAGELATGPVGTSTAPPARTRPATTTTLPKWVAPTFPARQRDRDAMVRVIRGYGLRDKAVLAAMAAVPRHEFVLPRYLHLAHADRPLPIGYGQTISQPYIVAEMTRMLKLKPASRVLEIGTGSAYQAAVLAHFTRHVYSIEIVKPLAKSGKARLKRLGYTVVEARAGDGYHGWPEKGPFDAIIVTCAAGRIPPPLIRQLAPGGRMVIPVGRPFSAQWLTLVTKRLDGSIRTKTGMGVRFVPMTGRAGKK
jgi:protein-L-isoaspartate(D-aspartate) O-methyltransferase